MENEGTLGDYGAPVRPRLQPEENDPMATNLGVEHLQFFDPIPSLYSYGGGLLYPVVKESVRQGWHSFS